MFVKTAAHAIVIALSERVAVLAEVAKLYDDAVRAFVAANPQYTEEELAKSVLLSVRNDLSQHGREAMSRWLNAREELVRHIDAVIAAQVQAQVQAQIDIKQYKDAHGVQKKTYPKPVKPKYPKREEPLCSRCEKRVAGPFGRKFAPDFCTFCARRVGSALAWLCREVDPGFTKKQAKAIFGPGAGGWIDFERATERRLSIRTYEPFMQRLRAANALPPNTVSLLCPYEDFVGFGGEIEK